MLFVWVGTVSTTVNSKIKILTTFSCYAKGRSRRTGVRIEVSYKRVGIKSIENNSNPATKLSGLMGIGKNEDHKLVKRERLWWPGRLLANHKEMTDHTSKQLEGSGQIQHNQGHYNDSMLKSKSHQEFNNHSII